jgi:hypothetical protein
MPGFEAITAIAEHGEAHDSLPVPVKMRLLCYLEGRMACSPGFSQGRGWVGGFNIPRHCKKKGYDITLLEMVAGQHLVVQA